MIPSERNLTQTRTQIKSQFDRLRALLEQKEAEVVQELERRNGEINQKLHTQMEEITSLLQQTSKLAKDMEAVLDIQDPKKFEEAYDTLPLKGIVGFQQNRAHFFSAFGCSNEYSTWTVDTRKLLQYYEQSSTRKSYSTLATD